MSNFTNTKIKDTFQRVLQIDNGEIQDGLGLPVDARIQSIESDLGFTGDLDNFFCFRNNILSPCNII